MANIIRQRGIEGLISPRVGVQGLIGWELVKDGKVVRESRLQPNLIVDSGMNALHGTAIANLTAWVGVGESNVAPAVGQTELVSPVGARTNVTGGFGATNGTGPGSEYVWWEFTRVFLEAEANGNLTEVGYFSAQTGGAMFNRQLLRDDLGNPTTIVKTSEHQLRIKFQYRIYRMINPEVNAGIDISGTIVEAQTRQISNVMNTFGSWSASIAGGPNIKAGIYESNVLPAFGGGLGGASGGSSGWTTKLTGSNPWFRQFEFVFEPVSGNFVTGVGGLQWGVVGAGLFEANLNWATVFNPKIPKTDVHRLRLTVEVGWDRVP